MNKEFIFQRMEELGISPKRSLGQNFLISETVIEKIINAVKKFEPNSLLEVGPGLGSLTEHLIKLNTEFQVVELDREFSKYWAGRGIIVNEEDALKWDWSNWKSDGRKVLVSNLPYQISSSLVIERSIDEFQIDAMVLMFQKEVAQRMKSTVGKEDYGMLSVITQSFWKVDNLLEAGPRDFFPAPKVASRVLTFEKIDRGIANKKNYLKFVKACFLHPRKLMSSNLVQALGIPKEKIIAIFTELKLAEKTRAEELKVEQFLALSEKLGYRN